jgi:putative peptide zinc metalloprotease protein
MTITEEQTAAVIVDSRAARDQPRLAEGVELIGEYEGSGFREPPSLVRRADGQMIQLPALLYSIAARADGSRTFGDIASEISDEIKRGLDADQVQYLVEEKLRPLGVLAAADGSSPEMSKPDPFLGLKMRMGVISERTSGALGGLFRPLFLPPVVLSLLAAFVAVDVWLFFVHGVAQALRQSILHPGLFLPLFLAVVVAAAFHEIGHAAACRYGGGTPGKMGCGLYLAWPAFYTDVTDAYRLGRRARLRTDLGGVYFNVVIILATVGAYFVTGFEPLLLLVVISHFEIVHQLLPVVRLDGYYIVADMTGVPDLFARIGPILRSLKPGHEPDERVTVLKPWVRVAVTAWVLVVVPLLVFELLIVLIHLPRMIGTGVASGRQLWHGAAASFSHSDVLGGVSSAVQILVLAIPLVGIVLMLVRTAQGGSRWMWQHTEGRPIARSLAVGAVGVGLVALGLAWIPKHNYDAIRPGEKGTLGEGVRAVRDLPTGAGPRASERAAISAGAIPVDPAAPGAAPAATTTTTAASAGTTTTATTSAGAPTTTTSTTVAPTTTTTLAPTTTTTVAASPP